MPTKTPAEKMDYTFIIITVCEPKPLQKRDKPILVTCENQPEPPPMKMDTTNQNHR